jgi:hypothetical protein
MSADSAGNAALNRYAYAAGNPINATDRTGHYLLMICGWTENCNGGDIGEWRALTLMYWLFTGRFHGANLDAVFDLFQGAKASGWSHAALINVFDADVWDSSNGGLRLDANNSAYELTWLNASLFAETGQWATYIAGFSWGAVTLNEYLYGLSTGKLYGHVPNGVYFVGGPDVHAITDDIRSLSPLCAVFGRGCHGDIGPLHTLGAPAGFDVAAAFPSDNINIVARKSAYYFPADKIAQLFDIHIGALNVDINTFFTGQITGGVAPGEDLHHCNHCVDPLAAVQDALKLFRGL